MTLFQAFFSKIPSSPIPAPLHHRRPSVGPERHHDLKLKQAIKPRLMPRQKKKKSVSISQRPRAPFHRILILIVRMPLITPPFPPEPSPSECDFICHLFFFQGLPPSLGHPPLQLPLAAGFQSHTVEMGNVVEWGRVCSAFLLPIDLPLTPPLPSGVTWQHKNKGLKRRPKTLSVCSRC